MFAYAEDRLRTDPRDPDALFIRAAYFARAKDFRRAIADLETLAEVDETYPGLWVLKTKLHAIMGDAEKAEESRARRLQVEKRLAEADELGLQPPPPPAEPLMTCPSCGLRVEEDDPVCMWCGAGLASLQTSPRSQPADPKLPPPPKPAPPVPTVLPRSPRVEPVAPAEPEMREPTEPAAPAPPATPAEPGQPGEPGETADVERRPLPPAPPVAPAPRQPERGPRGPTNGLARERRGTGRTNGLASGMTNGLASSVRELRSGMTNGLTNGSGFTNGLGSPQFRRDTAASRWRVYLIPVSAAFLLVLPLFGPGTATGRPIAIDGDASDWPSPLVHAQSLGGPNPNVDVTQFGIADNVDGLAILIEVAGTALRGGGAPPMMDAFHVFLDADGDPATGYAVDGLGADGLVRIAGWEGAANVSVTTTWDDAFDPTDWRGWRDVPVYAAIASAGGRIEAHVDWLHFGGTQGRAFATVHARGFDGATDRADFALNVAGGSFVVRQTPVVPAAIRVSTATLLRLEATAVRADARWSGVTITLTGSAPFSATTQLRILDAAGALVDVKTPLDRRVSFQFESTIPAGTTKSFDVVADTIAPEGFTLGALVADGEDVLAPGSVVTLSRAPAANDVGYIGTPPSDPRVDGGFDEWRAPLGDPTGDVTRPHRPDVDVAAFGAQSRGNASHFFAEVAGRFFRGAWVVEPNGLATSVGQPTDTDRDGVPNAVDPLPSDFNNDGIPDASAGGDFDGDGIHDYPSGGADGWLNATIPSSFPPPYGGRNVSVYVGPIEPPYQTRDDILRVFADLDNSSASGYAVGGVGADRMVELAGTSGRVRSAGVFAFTGAFPGHWSWIPLGPASFAVGYHRTEFASAENLTTAGARLYVEVAEPLGGRDGHDATRGTRSTFSVATEPAPSSFDVAPFPTRPAWDARTGTRASTLLDGGSNAVTTAYNHQRKVVRAGDVSGDGPCDATNSDGCWYSVFSDQFVEGANTWDRVIVMRSSDTAGSVWGAQVILASGRSADSPLVLSRDSAEPSIAIDASGFLHVVWVSASAAGDQTILDRIRYTKTTVAWPTQSELAAGANWEAVATVDASVTARPDGDVSTGSWTTAPLWQKIDEVTPSDADLIEENSGTGTTCEVSLSNLVAPALPSDHVIRFRAAVSPPGPSITVRLYQATTQIASFAPSLPGGFAEYSYTLTATEAASITDYNDLRLRFTSGALPRTWYVSWAEFEIVSANGFMPTVSTDTSNNPHIGWSGSKTGGAAYYKNKAAGTWRATVSWGSTYTGLSVDVSPGNNQVSLATSTGSWYDGGWQFRKKITIDRTKVSGTLSNFPVLISRTDSDLQTSAQGDGDDILFTSSDGTTKLSHEIERYTSSTGELVAFVRVPILSSSINTVLYLYYGNSAAANQQDAGNVWDVDYKAVWHLREDPGPGGAGDIKDSTVNANHGTAAAPMTSADLVSGKVGNALKFVGNTRVDAGDQPEFELPVYTWSMWIRGDSAATVLTSGDNQQVLYNADTQFQFDWSHWTSGFVKSAVHQDSVGWKSAQIASSLSGVTWYHIAGTYDGANIRVYRNGTLEATTAAGAPVVSAGPLTIGNYPTSTSGFAGRVDEVRISSSTRSANWIRTEFHNMNNPEDFASASPGMVARWRFDETTGTSAADTSGNGNTGTLFNGPVWTTGTIDGALSFEGVNDYVGINDSTTLRLATPLTVSAWFKTTSSATSGLVRKDTQVGTRYLYGLDVANGACGAGAGVVSAEYYNGAAFCVLSTTALHNGQWHHAVLTIAGTAMTLYIDGTAQGTTTITGTQGVPTGELDVGANPPYTGGGRGDFLNGQVDDVLIYNRALSPAEVASLSKEGGMRGHWKLDEGVGSTAADASGNGNTGTLQNGPAWTTGAIDGAVNFDGANDVIRVADAASLDISSAFTLSAWLRPDATITMNAGYNQGLMDKGVFQLFFDKSDGRLHFTATPSSAPTWTTSYNGAQEEIHGLAVYNGKVYAPQGTNPGDGDVLAYDGTSWTTSYDGAATEFFALAAYNGKLYAAQGDAAGNGDVFVYDGTTWSLSFDGAQEEILVLAVYDGRLYAGQGTGAGDGDVLVYDGTSWTTSYNGAQDSIASLAVYNGKLYAGQGFGAGDGDVLVYDGTSWTTSYDGAQEGIHALAVYDGKLYAGQGFDTGDSDVLVYDGTTWTTSYDGAQERINALATYNGKLYAGHGAGTGDGDVLVYDGTSWTTSYDGAQERVIGLATYNGRLYAGQGHDAADGDVFVYDNGRSISSSKSSWASEWHHVVASFDGTTMRLSVNGALDSSQSATFTPATNALDLLFGTTYGSQMKGGGPEAFDGILDDVRIYNRALGQTEVASFFGFSAFGAQEGPSEVHYLVCKNLATSNCDAAGEFTKSYGAAGFDTVASSLSAFSSGFVDGLSVAIGTTETTLGILKTVFPAGDNVVIATVAISTIPQGTPGNVDIAAGNLKLKRGATVLASNHFLCQAGGTVPSNTAYPTNYCYVMAKDTGAPANPTYDVTALASATGMNGEVKILALRGITATFQDGGSIPIGTTETTILSHATTLASGNNLIIAMFQFDNTDAATGNWIPIGAGRIKRGAGELASNGLEIDVQASGDSRRSAAYIVIARDAGAPANPTYDMTARKGQASAAVNGEVKVLVIQEDVAVKHAVADSGTIGIGTTETTIATVSTTFATGQNVVIASHQYRNEAGAQRNVVSGNDRIRQGGSTRSSNQFDLRLSDWATTWGGTASPSLLWRHAAATSSLSYDSTALASATGVNGEAKIAVLHVADADPRYASLASTHGADGDLWIAYAKEVDGTTRGIYARFLNYPAAAWADPEAVVYIPGTILTRPSIGIDRNSDVHLLYAATSGPQLYYTKRTSGSWSLPSPIDASSDHPTLMVRAPNDVTYGTDMGGLYWKSSASETYFFAQIATIPEFPTIAVPLSAVVLLGLWRRWVRRMTTGHRASRSSRPE